MDAAIVAAIRRLLMEGLIESGGHGQPRGAVALPRDGCGGGELGHLRRGETVALDARPSAR